VRLRKGWIPADPVAQHLGGSGVAARHSVSESHSDVHMPNPVIGAAVDARQEASRDARFDAIRRLIAKELHPDSGHAEEDGKELFTQMFQRIWPQIQEISRSLA
jgi:hypothetical protein